MLENPRDIMILLAQFMLSWNKRHISVGYPDSYGGPGVNIIQRYKNNPTLRKYYAGYMCSLKDTWGGKYTPGWAKRGEESWQTL